MQAPEVSRPLEARRSGPLKGVAEVPGDKSISHRALILGTLAVGRTKIVGLLEATDVLKTADAMRKLGATIAKEETGAWRVHGTGVGGFAEPNDILDFGNSGTGARLVMGAIATTAITAVFTGDASLRERPMLRVLEPLVRFGATFRARRGGLLPVTLTGATRPICIEQRVAVPSAQVKSALLLAALNARGRSRILQDKLTRDHTERMLRAFGAEIAVEQMERGEAISVLGETELHAANIFVPGDPSSAAFPLSAALIVPGSDVTLPNVLLNTRRTGFLETLREMGAGIDIVKRHDRSGEEVGDLVVRSSALKGTEVPPERAPSMIDEYPMLAVLAAFAEGRTVMRGLAELRVKESDRLASLARGLESIGVAVEELPDGLVVEGCGGDSVRGGARIATHLDHRIAMSFLVAGLGARQPVVIDDSTMIRTSFPGFRSLMRGLGANFAPPQR